MAYLVSSVGLSKFKYPLEECNRFLQLKRYLRDQAGGTKLNFGLLSGIPAPRDLVP